MRAPNKKRLTNKTLTILKMITKKIIFIQLVPEMLVQRLAILSKLVAVRRKLNIGRRTEENFISKLSKAKC